jgi:hypothetical protein
MRSKQKAVRKISDSEVEWYMRVAPNDRVQKHRFLKHREQKHLLFTPKHLLAKTSTV